MRDEEVESLEAIEKLVEAAVRALSKKDETDDPYDKICLHNIEQRLQVFKQAFVEE